MTTLPKVCFKAEFIPMLRKELNFAKKPELKNAFENISPKNASNASKNQLIDEIVEELYHKVLSFKDEFDAVNKAQEFLKSWFRNELGQIIKPASVQSFEALFKKEFEGVDIIKPKTVKFNQTFVPNIWTEEKVEEYPCICPKGPSNLCEKKASQNCYMCGVQFHMDCLWGRGKDQKSNTTLSECPSCFLTNCIAHKRIQKVLFAGYLPTSKSSKLEFLINFAFPAELKANKKISLEARCMRIKPQADYNRYEITWPDNSTLFLNSKKITDFKLMSINSAVKRRGDEEVVLDKSNTYCEEYESLVIEEKHDYDPALNKYDFASHFIMVMAVSQESEQDLLAKFKAKRLSIPESKQILKNYLNKNSNSEIELKKFSILLKCPLFSTKIIIPVRSRHCQTHFQPFDLQNFLTLNRIVGKGAAQKYKCPICKKRAYDLVVDEYLQDLMCSKNNGGNVNEISFRADGEPHFEEEEDSANQSEEETSRPQKETQNVNVDESKIVEESKEPEAIDIDLSPIEEEQPLPQHNQTNTYPLSSEAKLEEGKKISQQFLPNKPLIFDKKTPSIFERLESKKKVPQVLQMLNKKKKQREILSQVLGKDKDLNRNELLSINNLPEKPVSTFASSAKNHPNGQGNKQKESELKGSARIQTQISSNQIITQSAPKLLQNISQIIQEERNTNQNTENLGQKMPETIEISSGDECIQEVFESRKTDPKSKSQSKNHGKPQLKHNVYTIKEKVSRNSKPKAQSANSTQKKQTTQQKSKPAPNQKSQEQDNSYEYEYELNENERQNSLNKSNNDDSYEYYYGESDELHQNEKKRDYIREINQHIQEGGSKKVKLDKYGSNEYLNSKKHKEKVKNSLAQKGTNLNSRENEISYEETIYTETTGQLKGSKQADSLPKASQMKSTQRNLNKKQLEGNLPNSIDGKVACGTPIECIQLSDQDEKPVPLVSSNQANSMQLEGSEKQNNFQSIVEQSQQKKSSYWTELQELREEMEKNRKQIERRKSQTSKTHEIKEDDEKMFYQLIEEMNQLNNYQIFC